jgi:hypothetical protein
MMQENLRYSDQAATAAPVSPGISQAEADMLRGEGPAPVEPGRKARKPNKSRKAVQEFLGGDYLSQEWVTGNLAYIFYVAFLAMIYIGNTYYTEKKFNSIERTKNELKELRYQYITTKSNLMFLGRQSEISKQAVTYGLRETTMPPYKILYSGEALNPPKEIK